MIYLANILEAVKNNVKAEVIGNFKTEQKQWHNNSVKVQMIDETDGFTEAVIETVKQDTFTPLKVFLSWMCKIYIEQGIRLAEIMAFFDLYEQSLKDTMSFYLREDLISLNQYRREFDTLLDKARVYVSDYFFILYEETVDKQFNQLRIINEITAHLTSSLDLNEVLNFIVTNVASLFKADCDSILLINEQGTFSTRIAYGWQVKTSPNSIVQNITLEPGVMILDCSNIKEPLNKHFAEENLQTVLAVKLQIQERIIGVIVIGFRATRKFTPTEERLLETFANQAAIAVNNAQLYGETDDKLQEHIREITIMLEKNRALLHSLREGVIAISADERVDIINGEAQRLLNLHEDVTGSKLSDVIPDARLPFVVKSKTAEYDQEEQLGNNFIIINRVPVVINDKVIGAIATFRDKKDVKELAEELVGVKSLLDSVRAQSHEFINKLHAISGLIEMGQYDKVVEFITDINKNRQDCVSFIVKRIKEKATAGLLLGKISQSTERGIVLYLKPRSKLANLPPGFNGISMVTVLGNLISNAMDAVANLPTERRTIEVYIFEGIKFLTIRVSDQGCGILPEYLKNIYQRGFSTKQGGRGIGLALVKQEVEMSGGRITVKSVQNQGSTFIVKIPVR